MNWVITDGFENSNSAEIVNLNISKFLTDVGSGNFYFKAFLNNASFDQKTSLDDISLSYVFYNNPIIESIDSDSGSNDSIKNIKFNGSNFVDGLKIKLSREDSQDIFAKNIHFVNSNELNADFDLILAPIGVYNITLINPDKRSFTLENAFTIKDASPLITGITPQKGYNNAVLDVEIQGSNFKEGLKVNFLKSGEKNIECVVTEILDTNIKCNLDLTGKTRGSWDFEIINPSGLSARVVNQFNVTPLSISYLSQLLKRKLGHLDLRKK